MTFQLALILLKYFQMIEKGQMMKNNKNKIHVTERNGVYRVSAHIGKDFHLVPAHEGTMKLAFWDEKRLKIFLKNFGLYPVIMHNN